MPSTRSQAPRSPLLHPFALAALIVLLVNDHVLKGLWPGLVTGKASDVAALVLVPPLAVELADRVWGGRAFATTAGAAAAAIFVAATFVAVKTVPIANEAYAIGLGLIQWPATLLGGLLATGQVSPPGRAPTVLDSGDLVTLPAAALGWWIASGRARWPVLVLRPGTTVAFAGRVAALLAAVFTLAATSQSFPTELVGTASDEVIITPGEAPLHRHLEIRSDASSGYEANGLDSPVSIVIEARPRWPRVEPAARLVVSRIDKDSVVATGTGSVLSIPREACSHGCTIGIDVVIDWPAESTKPPTSVAWELVVTVRSPEGGSIGGTVDVSGDGLRPTAGAGSGPWFAGLGLVPIAAIGLGVGLRPGLPARPRRTRAVVDAAVVGSVTMLAVALAVLPFVVPPASLEPAAGGMAYSLVYVGPTLAIALVSGLARWWRGAGEWLAIVLIGGALALLLFGARLAGAASETFLVQGLWVASMATILVSLAVAGAVAGRSRQDVAKPIRKEVRPLASSRLLVAAIQVALVVGLATVHWPTAAFLAGALGVWWSGSGALLGLVSTALAAGFAAMLFFDGSLLLSGPRWMPIEAVTLGLAVLASVIGMLAAFGGIGRHPGGGVPDEAPVPRPIPID